MKKILSRFFSKAEAAFRERSPRVRIPLVDQACLELPSGRRFPLLNISETGVAIDTGGERLPDEINGELRVAGHGVYVELLVVWREDTRLGATFGDGAASLRALLRNAFADEVQALGMSEVDASKQKPVEVGSPRWFYAPGNYELFFVVDGATVLRFEVEWGGKLLAWLDGGLRYGVVDRDFKEAVEHAQSALVKWEAGVPEEARMKAFRILENIPKLEPGLRDQMQEVLKLAP